MFETISRWRWWVQRTQHSSCLTRTRTALSPGQSLQRFFFFNLKLYLVPNMTWWWDVTKWNVYLYLQWRFSTKMFSPLFLGKLTRRSPRRWQRSRLRPFLPSLTITEMGRWARRSSSSLWNQKRAKRDPNSKRINISSLYHCYHPADRQHSFIFPYSSTIRDKQD